MKKILYLILMFAAIFAALALTACGKDESETTDSVIPFVSDFTCDYYDANDNIISDKSTVFSPDDEIRVKISFTLSNEAYAAGKRNFTIKFMPTVGFDGRIQSANSSSTSDKNFTATYSVDDRNAKKCEVEVRITVSFSRGSLNVGYSYDGEEFSDVVKTPLNNDKTLSFEYDEKTDGYKVSKDPENGDWVDKSVKLTFPESFAGKPVTVIDSALFGGCVNLKSITVPSSVKEIGDYNTFGNCPIEEAAIPAAFVGYMPKSTLKSVKIVGDGDIGWYYDGGDSYSGFKNCVNLTSVELPDNVGSIVNNAFEGCDKLQYNEYGGARYLGNAKNPYVALVSVTSKYLSYTDVHEKTKVICDNAFEYYSNLEGITLYDGLRIIGKNAFMHCSKLKSINIPDSITKVDDAFWGCNSIKYNEYENAYYLGNEKNPYVVLMATYGATSVRMNASTKIIRNGAFTKNENLTSVAIDGVTRIDEGRFKGCKNLTDVTISDKVTSIGAYAFSDCVSLKSITIPNGVTSIEGGTFSGCAGLTSITIPNGVTSIEGSAFSGCAGLTSITVPEGVTSIGYNAFDGCSGLTSITIPDSVTEIGASAFYNCNKLRYNEYGNSYYLGNEKNPYHALIAAVNTSVTSVDINENAKTIANYAFAKRTELTSITIPGSVKHIGDDAFYNCSGLREVIISEGVTTIGDYVFNGCESLNVTIPKSVTSVGAALFGGRNYMSITYGGTVKEWLNFTSRNGVVAADGDESVAVQCTDEPIRFIFY